MTLFLIFTQQVRHKFDYNACPNFQSESHDTWILKFQLPLLLHKQSNNDWNETLSKLFWCFLNFFKVESHPECSVPSIEVRPSLKCVYHSWVCVLLMTLFPKVCFNILKVSKNVFLNLKQNFTQTCCSFFIPEKFAKQAR